MTTKIQALEKHLKNNPTDFGGWLMTNQNMNTSELIDRLLEQAREMVIEGHIGWGNTMLDAAQKLKECEDAMKTFVLRVENGEVKSKKTYSQFRDILGL